MACLACSSANQTEFTAEVNIHFRGRQNIDNPGVLLFPKLLVCMDCGASHFSTPQPALSQLATPLPIVASTLNGSADSAVYRRRTTLGE
jgi:hypothetical protein